MAISEERLAVKGKLESAFTFRDSGNFIFIEPCKNCTAVRVNFTRFRLRGVAVEGTARGKLSKMADFQRPGKFFVEALARHCRCSVYCGARETVGGSSVSVVVGVRTA